jgi:hypothetical protein
MDRAGVAEAIAQHVLGDRVGRRQPDYPAAARLVRLADGGHRVALAGAGKPMDERSRDVLAAADSWLTAIQAMAAADEEQRRTKVQQLDRDDAEVALVAAVLAWRDAGPDQKRLRCLSIGRWTG